MQHPERIPNESRTDPEGSVTPYASIKKVHPVFGVMQTGDTVQRLYKNN